MNPYVFISHAPVDLVKAQRLYDDLKEAGVSPWMSENDLLHGSEHWDVIVRMIRECRYFIALLSYASLSERGDFQKELRAALDKREEFPGGEISVIPVRIDECETIDERLRRIHPVDLFPSYGAGFGKLLWSLGHTMKHRLTSDIAKADNIPDDRAEKKRWFKFILKLNGETELFNSEHPTDKTPMLAADKRYRLILVAEKIEKEANNQCLSVTEPCNEIDVHVNAVIPKDGFVIENPLQTLRLNEEDKYELFFDVITEPNIAGGETAIRFEIIIREDTPKKAEYTIPAKLDSEYGSDDIRFLNTCNLVLDTYISPQTAIMHAYAEGTDKNKVRLSFWALGRKNRDSDICFHPPIVCLADFISKEKKPGDRVAPPKTIIAKIRGLSNLYGKIGLRDLIGKLDKSIGKEMILIIIDHTKFEIPWELWELAPGEFLGAKIAVARWLPLPESCNNTLNVRKTFSAGKVLLHVDKYKLTYYEDAEEKRKNETLLNHEISIFNSYQRACEIEDYRSIDRHMDENFSEIGLVYIGGEGFFSKDNSNDIAVGSEKKPEDRLCALDLDYLDCDGRHRFFFINNACHSARILIENISNPYGFPRSTLKIASGYIGTLAPIESNYAVDIVTQLFLKHYTEKNGIAFAEALRELRASAAEDWKNDKWNVEKQYRFIFTFTYVYYGNPLARLRLFPAEKVKNTNGTCGEAHND